MAKTLDQILAKLDRPPAAHHWALCNHPEQARTTSSLVNLALGFPTISYQWALTVIQNTVADGLSDIRAIQNLERICPPSQLAENLDLLNAFLTYNEERRYSGFRVFDEFAGQFRAGPDVIVPVKPTLILNEGGILKPLFVIGWAKNTLRFYQRRLLASIYEDAIFSLTDLRQSPGEVLLFPKNGYGVRKLEKWDRRTYSPLSKEELAEQITRYIEARKQARPVIGERYRARAEAKAREHAERRAAARTDRRTAKDQ